MKNFILIFLTLTVISSLSAQTKEDKKKNKDEEAFKEYETTKALIESGAYVIEATWATSHKGRRINLTTNYNFLKINQQEADIDLPFFGRGYSGSAGYGGDSGIKFKGVVENYKVEFNDKKQKITINFNGNGKNDNYNFNLSIFKSGSTGINVSSNNRSAMNYDGKLAELKKTE